MTDSMMPDIQRARVILSAIGWQDVQIESVPGGTVNSTWRLFDGDAVWYLRIGPTDAEVNAGPSWFTGKGLRREQLAIAQWGNHRRYFPETVHTDFSHDLIASDWVIQKAVPGEAWEGLRARLTPDQNTALWQQFGQLVAELHAYSGAEFGPPEPGYGFTRWSEFCRWDVTGLLTDAHLYDLPRKPFEQLCELIDRSTHELDEITSPRLIHSDLGLRHVLITFDSEDQPEISGILDSEFARFADPASESIFVTQALMPQLEFRHFEETYGARRMDRDERLRAHIYQLIAMGWWITDAARRQRPTEVSNLLGKMNVLLSEEKHLW